MPGMYRYPNRQVFVKPGADFLQSRWQACSRLGLETLLQEAADEASAGSTVLAATPAGASPCRDPNYTEPYIDIDEGRDRLRRHRYGHGGSRERTLEQPAFQVRTTGRDTVKHVFDEAGTYWPTVRVKAHRSGDPVMAERAPATVDHVRVLRNDNTPDIGPGDAPGRVVI